MKNPLTFSPVWPFNSVALHVSEVLLRKGSSALKADTSPHTLLLCALRPGCGEGSPDEAEIQSCGHLLTNDISGFHETRFSLTAAEYVC